MLTLEEVRRRYTFKINFESINLENKEVTILTEEEYQLLTQIDQIKQKLLQIYDDNTKKLREQPFDITYKQNPTAYLRRKI